MHDRGHFARESGSGRQILEQPRSPQFLSDHQQRRYGYDQSKATAAPLPACLRTNRRYSSGLVNHAAYERP